MRGVDTHTSLPASTPSPRIHPGGSPERIIYRRCDRLWHGVVVERELRSNRMPRYRAAPFELPRDKAVGPLATGELARAVAAAEPWYSGSDLVDVLERMAGEPALEGDDARFLAERIEAMLP